MRGGDLRDKDFITSLPLVLLIVLLVLLALGTL
jgi:hypothetical protein